MPEVFDALLKPGEIADLVAYLKTETLPGTSAASGGKSAKQEAAAGDSRAPADRSCPVFMPTRRKASPPARRSPSGSAAPFPTTCPSCNWAPIPRTATTIPCWKRFREKEPQAQPIHPGSYVHVAKGLPDERRLTQLTLEGWIRPFALTGWQGLITQHDYPDRCGIGLFLNGDRLAFITGPGGAHDPASLHETRPGLIEKQRWHHVAATWDGKVKRLFIDGKPAGEFPFAGVVKPGRTALRLGAYGEKGVASHFYNGDLAMCAVHDRALDAKQIRKRVADRG